MSNDNLFRLRPVWERLLIFGCLPLFDVWQELRLTGDVFPQHLRDGKTLGCLVVLEQAAEGSFSCAYYNERRQ